MKGKRINWFENDKHVIKLLSNFSLNSTVSGSKFDINPIESGRLHNSYCLSLLDGRKTPKYVIQKMNPLFDLVALNYNLRLFEYAQEKSHLFFPENWQTVKYLDVADGSGKIYFDQEGNAWRIIEYIPGGIRFFERFGEVPENFRKAVAYNLGETLVFFHQILAQVPNGRWKTPLPNFHKTNYHYKYLKSIIRGERTILSLCRDQSCEVELQKDFFKKYRTRIDKLLAEIEKQKRLIFCLDGLGLSVQHGDPKLNNAVFRKDSTNQWRCCALIDLDTIQIGGSLDDLGDALRSAGNKAGEQPANLDLINIDDMVVGNLIEGYLNKTKKIYGLANANRLEKYVYKAYAKFLCELGMRFLADSLIGNHYFRLSKGDPIDFNLYRAEVQLRTLEILQKSYNI